MKGSIELLTRSIGEIKTINNESIIHYNITYKSDVISPSDGDQFECKVETINKLGVIGYIHNKEGDTLEDSPFIIIIIKKYINEKTFSNINIHDTIKVEIKSFRIKYLLKQIQIVAILV